MKDKIFNSRELDELINYLSELSKDNNIVYRGYNKQDELLPNIIRDKDFTNFENLLLERFERFGSNYFEARSPIDFLSYGQHYGIPTRLLDFTFNPFIALSFSLFKKKSSGKYSEPEDKDYYYIRYTNLNDNIHLKSIPVLNGFTFGSFDLESISLQTSLALRHFTTYLTNEEINFHLDYIQGINRCAFNNESELSLVSKIRKGSLVFIDPNHANQRIIMQQGLFLLPYDLNLEKHIGLILKNSNVIKIHKKLRNDLLTYLDTLGYNTYRLMPDLMSICNAITNTIKNNWIVK